MSGPYETVSITVVNWNVEWATPGSWSRRDEILSRIDREAPDIVCLTESDIRLLAGMPGHTIHSQPDGVKGIDNRRKVLLWSREPWEQVDDFGSDSMPPGRFVSGVTRTPQTLGGSPTVSGRPPEGVRAGLIEAIDRPGGLQPAGWAERLCTAGDSGCPAGRHPAKYHDCHRRARFRRPKGDRPRCAERGFVSVVSAADQPIPPGEETVRPPRGGCRSVIAGVADRFQSVWSVFSKVAAAAPAPDRTAPVRSRRAPARADGAPAVRVLRGGRGAGHRRGRVALSGRPRRRTSGRPVLPSDIGQRNFQTPFSWRALGVDIRGRSHTLRVNYRTSHQIRRQADRLLPPETSDVDGNTDRRTGTASVFNGASRPFGSSPRLMTRPPGPDGVNRLCRPCRCRCTAIRSVVYPQHMNTEAKTRLHRLWTGSPRKRPTQQSVTASTSRNSGIPFPGCLRTPPRSTSRSTLLTELHSTRDDLPSTPVTP